MLKRLDTDLQLLNEFLQVKTPSPWLDQVNKPIPPIIPCERKAAATASNLISKYPQGKELMALMPPSAREGCCILNAD